MKKITVAAIITLMSVGLVNAWHCCPRRSCAPRACRTACPTRCEPVPPKCCKTIQVPQTIMVDKVIEVPANKIVMKQAPLKEYIPQEPIEIRTPQPALVIPQPDCISYKCVPDKVRLIPQPDIIRYECPIDTECVC